MRPAHTFSAIGTYLSPTVRESLRPSPMFKLRHYPALALLDITANLVDESLAFAELCETDDETRGKARGELASLTTIVRKHFHHDPWPVDAQWEEGRLWYRMAPDIAAFGRAVAEGSRVWRAISVPHSAVGVLGRRATIYRKPASRLRDVRWSPLITQLNRDHEMHDAASVGSSRDE